MTREEAIKILMGHSHTPQERAALEVLIPELRESEDERISKELIAFFQDDLRGDYWHDLEVGHILAWLGKQKEQKPAEKQDYSGLNDLERAILRGFLCAGVENVPVEIIKNTATECIAFLALIEPKPAEWSKEDERILTSIIERGSSQVPFGEPALREEQMEWLMNQLKFLRHSWKPSEEQMAALYTAARESPIIKENGNYLYDLYEQLKKL